MEVTLIVAEGPAAVRRIRLRSAETIVGREKGCDLRIPSAEVSRRHCLLSFADGQLTVEDLDSSNGTYLNRARVTGRAPVRAGDRLRVGPVTFTVDYSTSPKAASRPDPASRPTEPEAKVATRPAKPVGQGEDLPIPLADEPLPPAKARPEPSGPAAGVIPLQDDSRTEEIEPVEFDDSQPLRLPEGEDFRDFLSRMEE